MTNTGFQDDYSGEGNALLIFLNFHLFIFGCAGVFIAVQAFSSCGEQGLLSSCGAQKPLITEASHAADDKIKGTRA